MDLPAIDVTDDGPAARGASPALLADLLAELDLEAAKHVGPIWAQPGRPASDVRNALAALELDAPDELITLYGWHDGIAVGQPSPYPRFGITPLDISCIGYTTRQNALKATAYLAENPEDLAWGGGPGWFPLYPDNYTLVVDCRGVHDGAPKVRATDPAFEEHQSPRKTGQVVSLCTVITWRIEGIRSGIHWWDEKARYWETDWAKLPELQRVTAV